MTVIIRRSPTRALTFFRPVSLMEEVDRLARGFWDSGSVTFPTSYMPRVDIYEEKDELVVKAELPGIKKEDLSISLENDMLSIKAEKKEEAVSEEATFYTCERHFGQYSRSVSLPYHVDTEKISATLKNGLLKIRLPKAEEAKSKHIEVNVR